jgi:hypothetical protein
VAAALSTVGCVAAAPDEKLVALSFADLLPLAQANRECHARVPHMPPCPLIVRT